jgi:hypothetical protein
MLAFTDCVHFSNLTPDEVDAIAEHEHIDDMLACELGQTLASDARGCQKILKFMVEDMQHAEEHHDFARSYQLHQTINHFAAEHHFI